MSVPYCRRKLLPGEILGTICDGPDGCGHLLAVHVGVDHCPVCELVDIAEHGQDELLRAGAITLNSYRQRRGLIDPPQVEPINEAGPVTVNITVEGSLLAEGDLRRIVDEQIVQHIKNTSGYYNRAFRR